MSESAKRGGEPREGVRGRGRERRGDWRTKHLRACLLCGRVWRPRRRRTCPTCHVDRSICLTCDQVAVEDRARRCATDEALRRLVKVCAGDWEWARRALDAAGGDIPRALSRAERTGPGTMVTPAQRAEIRRLFYGEGRKLGTIAAQIGLHHETVRAAIEHVSDRWHGHAARSSP